MEEMCSTMLFPVVGREPKPRENIYEHKQCLNIKSEATTIVTYKDLANKNHETQHTIEAIVRARSLPSRENKKLT